MNILIVLVAAFFFRKLILYMEVDGCRSFLLFFDLFVRDGRNKEAAFVAILIGKEKEDKLL